MGTCKDCKHWSEEYGICGECDALTYVTCGGVKERDKDRSETLTTFSTFGCVYFEKREQNDDDEHCTCHIPKECAEVWRKLFWEQFQVLAEQLQAKGKEKAKVPEHLCGQCALKKGPLCPYQNSSLAIEFSPACERYIARTCKYCSFFNLYYHICFCKESNQAHRAYSDFWCDKWTLAT